MSKGIGRFSLPFIIKVWLKRKLGFYKKFEERGKWQTKGGQE